MDGDDCAKPGGFADLEELLELLGLAVEPVEVVDDHGVDVPALDVVKHAAVVGPVLAGVGGDVVVDVLLGDRPPSALGLGTAVG